MPFNALEIPGPPALIDRLRRNPAVLAIIQYGGGVCPKAADTDLCVVVTERPAGLESAHFWIGNGPVDLNVRTLDELKACNVDPGFDEELRRGEVLYEREPGLLDGALRPLATDEAPLNPEGTTRTRFGYAHWLTKLVHYEDRDPLLCKVMLCGVVHGLLHAYCHARGRRYTGEKNALAAIEADDPALLADLETASGDADLYERIEAARRLAERFLDPIGGTWQRGEILFFTTNEVDEPQRDEWEAFLASLMSPDR
jgi:hypothetical protein